MASLERWKTVCLLFFVLITLSIAKKSSNVDSKQPINASSYQYFIPNCALLDKMELASFKRAANDVCSYPPQTSSQPSSLRRHQRQGRQTAFCEILKNVTRAMCTLDEGGQAEIFLGSLNNSTASVAELCAQLSALTSSSSLGSSSPSLIDGIKAAVNGDEMRTTNESMCARNCNGTAQVLCTFMLLASHVLSPDHENFVSVVNPDAKHPTISTVLAAVPTTSAKLQSANADSSTGARPPLVSTGNRTWPAADQAMLHPTTKSPIGSVLSETELALPAIAVSHPNSTNKSAEASTGTGTARSRSPSRTTTLTDVQQQQQPQPLSGNKTSVVTSTGGSTVLAKGSKPESTVDAIGGAAGRRKTTATTTTLSPLAAAAVPAEPFDDFQDTDDEAGVMPATVSFPSGSDLDEEDNANSLHLPQNEDEYADDLPSPIDKGGIETGDVPVKSVPQKHGTFSIAYPDGSGSGFLPVFFMFIVLSISLYFVYHYRNKIMGLLLEGRSERRRRPNTNQYRRLSNKLEDVLPVEPDSAASKRVANIIY